MIRYNGIYHRGDWVIKKPEGEEQLVDVQFCTYANICTGEEGRTGFFYRKIAVSAEIKKNREWLKPWCLILFFFCWQLKSYCTQPWRLLVTFLIFEIFWTNWEKGSQFMTGLVLGSQSDIWSHTRQKYLVVAHCSFAWPIFSSPGQVHFQVMKGFIEVTGQVLKFSKKKKKTQKTTTTVKL